MPCVTDLFSGCGGLSKGFELAGFTIVQQVEKDRHCLQVLERHFPEAVRRRDITEEHHAVEATELLIGGDPCPVRSLAKGNRKSSHPDLAGYFLCLAGRLRPRWVVRENVPSPDVVHFAAALEYIGYRVAAFALDARDFTGQSRRRQFIVASSGENAAAFERALSNAADGFGFSASSAEETEAVAACLTAHPSRLAAEDSYCYEPGRGLRLLTPEEYEGLQGFPRGWTSGFSRSRRRIMLGNAVPVPFGKFIGELILSANGDAWQ